MLLVHQIGQVHRLLQDNRRPQNLRADGDGDGYDDGVDGKVDDLLTKKESYNDRDKWGDIAIFVYQIQWVRNQRRSRGELGIA